MGQFAVIKDGVPQGSSVGPSLVNADLRMRPTSSTVSPFFFCQLPACFPSLCLSSGYFLQTLFPPSQRSFQGCMQAILVDDQPADLHAVEKGTVGAFENVSLDMCAIIDR